MKHDTMHPGSPDTDRDATHGRAWYYWLGQVATLIYLIGGAFLIYQYFKRLRLPTFLIVGVLFVLYGIYRFFLVRRKWKSPRF